MDAHYHTVTRYTANGFLRMKLGEGSRSGASPPASTRVQAKPGTGWKPVSGALRCRAAACTGPVSGMQASTGTGADIDRLAPADLVGMRLQPGFGVRGRVRAARAGRWRWHRACSALPASPPSSGHRSGGSARAARARGRPIGDQRGRSAMNAGGRGRSCASRAGRWWKPSSMPDVSAAARAAEVQQHHQQVRRVAFIRAAGRSPGWR